MAVAHLAAALTAPVSSPVVAVGGVVVDASPTPVKEWAVRELGAADKPVLVGSVVVGALVLAAVSGLLARRHLAAGAAAQVLLVVVAAAAVLIGPGTGALDLLPALVALLLGPSLLWALAHRAASGMPSAEVATGPGHRSEAPSVSTSRRGVLVLTASAAALAAVAAVSGQAVVRARTRLGALVLPRAARPLPPLPAGLEETHEGISPLRTPTADFYRVDTKLTVPLVDHTGWRLHIDGDVDEELSFSYDDLVAGRAGELVERDITLTCVSNEVGGNLLGSARWTGVLLAPLLERAGVGRRADQVLSTDVEGFTISTPLSAVLDGRDAMVAIGLNGEVLPREHGFPARLVVPGLYGFVGATKWVTRLTLTRYEEVTAYWTDRGWATQAPIRLSSRIDTPKPLSTVPVGPGVIGGVAWAQPIGVAKVEVRIDGGGWKEARLGPEVDDAHWRQWFLPWEATPGQHRLAVRCTDKDGTVQTAVRATPFPQGSSGIQEVVVTAA
jgi:DMSO/TMAO reductase YedYZ molybdopterin-dependent catalytic subunit